MRSRIERFFGSHGWRFASASSAGWSGRSSTATTGRAAACWSHTSASSSSRPARVSTGRGLLRPFDRRLRIDRRSAADRRDASRSDQFSYRIDPSRRRPASSTSLSTTSRTSSVPAKTASPTGDDPRQPSQRYRRRARVSGDVRLRGDASRSRIDGKPVAGPPARPLKEGEGSRSLARRARSSIASSSARSTARRANPGPTRDPTIPGVVLERVRR